MEVTPQSLDDLANRIEGLGHGAVLVESERNLILYALREMAELRRLALDWRVSPALIGVRIKNSIIR